MTAGDALPPEAVEATDAAGAALIDALVARRRAELARLSLAARTARQRCERAERELAGMGDVDADGVPSDLLGVVDAMLAKAIGASELALASAEREASFIVDRAMADGAEAVRRAGLDPAVLLSGRAATAPARAVAAPPTAAELWRTTRRASSPRSVAPAPGWPAPMANDQVSAVTPPAAPASLPRTAPGPVASAPFVPVVVPDRAAVEGVSAPAHAWAPATTLLLDEPVEPAPTADQGDAFDTFWQEVPGERRVRDRLLRRSPKESA